MLYLAPNLGNDRSLSMKLYLDDLVSAFDTIGFSDFRIIVPPTLGNPGRLRIQWERYIAFPRLISKTLSPEDRLHVIDHSYGHLCAAHPKSTVTCHDIAEYRLTELRGHQLNLWKKRVRDMRHASIITAISSNTKRDIVELLEISEHQVAVNHYGHDTRFSPGIVDKNKVWDEFGLSDEFQRGCHMILHVGSNIHRKNIPVLLSAIAILKNSGMDIILVKVGDRLSESKYANMIRSLGISGCVKDLGGLTLDQLVTVYRSADAFSFPSTYEGFGRPILEAQGCGCPSVIAASSCLAEVGGNGSLYHDPLDCDELARQLRAILTDPDISESLRENGLKNIQRFSWDKHARLLLETLP
jgi:glycosyltransferase involved in cell wall biosynthesis